MYDFRQYPEVSKEISSMVYAIPPGLSHSPWTVGIVIVLKKDIEGMQS